LEPTHVISIVDDDEAVRESIGELIRSLGYIVTTFASAEDYLRSDRFHVTSCLIADVQMPGMSGVELQERLNARGCNTRIIFMTAFRNEKLRARSLSAGAIGFLYKPFSDASLIECLNKALQV
jgi:FixJ family two-component response regulator